MSINNSMTVTGYYYVTPTQTRGFVRNVEGTITTFDIAGAVWIEAESINARGDITGFYRLAATPPQPPYDLTGNQPQGFLRYADAGFYHYNKGAERIRISCRLPPKPFPFVARDDNGAVCCQNRSDADALFTMQRGDDL